MGAAVTVVALDKCRSTDLEVPPQILAIRAEHNHIPDDEAFASRQLKGALCREAELFPVQSLSQVSV